MVSETFVTEANKENRTLPLTLVTISHDDLDADLNFTSNGADITSNDTVYTAFPFQYIPPQHTRDGIQPGRLVISNISGDIVEACRSLAGSGPAECSFRFVMPDDPDTVERKWPKLKLRNVLYSTSALSGSLCHAMFNTEPHTQVTASEKYFTGL